MQQEETLLHAAGGKDVAEFLVSKVDVMLSALDLVCAGASTFLYLLSLEWKYSVNGGVSEWSCRRCILSARKWLFS